MKLPSDMPGERRFAYSYHLGLWHSLWRPWRNREFWPLAAWMTWPFWNLDFDFCQQISKSPLFLVTWIFLLKNLGQVNILFTRTYEETDQIYILPPIILFGNSGNCGSSQALQTTLFILISSLPWCLLCVREPTPGLLLQHQGIYIHTIQGQSFKSASQIAQSTWTRFILSFSAF